MILLSTVSTKKAKEPNYIRADKIQLVGGRSMTSDILCLFVTAWPQMSSALDNKHALQRTGGSDTHSTGNDCTYKRIILLLTADQHLPDGL